jgi:hypothetical protein
MQDIWESGFKLDLPHQAIVVFQRFQFSQLSGELLFKFAEFGEAGHVELL